MPATIKRSAQNANVHGAYGIMSSDKILADCFTSMLQSLAEFGHVSSVSKPLLGHSNVPEFAIEIDRET